MDNCTCGRIVWFLDIVIANQQPNYCFFYYTALNLGLIKEKQVCNKNEF